MEFSTPFRKIAGRYVGQCLVAVQNTPFFTNPRYSKWGRPRGSSEWSITDVSGTSKNETGLTLGGIKGVDKLGWDYLWVKYEQDKDATANCLVLKAIGVYADEEYQRTPMSGLGV